MTDTSDEAIERLAIALAEWEQGWAKGDEPPAVGAATLRELVAERTALRQERDAALTDARDFHRQSEIAYAERDAARAKALEEATAVADSTDTGWFDARTFTAQKIAAAIRALAQKEPQA